MEIEINNISKLLLIVVVLISGFLAAASPSLLFASISLVICGLAVGGVWLVHGAEYIAFVQWITTLFVGISFILLAQLFGRKDAQNQRWAALVPFAIGVVFLVFILRFFEPQWLSIPAVGVSIRQMGNWLIEDHLAAVLLVGILLFLSVVGVGLIARSEGFSDREASEGNGDL